MKRKIITYLLLFSFLNYIGCSSTVFVTVNELSTKELMENPPHEIFITTHDSKKYYFSKDPFYYYFRNDTLFGKGSSEEFIYENGEKNYTGYLVMFEGNIPSEEISSIIESGPDEITVTTKKGREFNFRNEGYYYLQNDTLYGHGDVQFAGHNEEFTGSIVFSDILKINSGLTVEKENTGKAGKRFNIVKEENNEGIDLTFLLKNGTYKYGELLSVRDSTIIICKNFSAAEEEIAEGIYPVRSIDGREIQNIIIEGESKFWVGVGYGALIGAVFGAGVVLVSDNDKGGLLSFSSEEANAVMGIVFFALFGAIIGGITGSFDYSDEVIIQLPPDYDYSVLKSLARYLDKEPEYLKAIK